MKFALEKERPGGANEDMWGVCYEASATDTGLQYVMAVRDPFCSIAASDYRAATTGDYDLFAVYAKETHYRPDTRDRRMVGHATLESNIRTGAEDLGEDKDKGNVSPRILEIGEALNTAIARKGYSGGKMVHHSDEGGRPFVRDIDLPVFAVVPGADDCYGIEGVDDLREFISVTLGRAYAPMFNPGWMKQLVYHSDPQIARDIHTELMSKIRSRQSP